MLLWTIPRDHIRLFFTGECGFVNRLPHFLLASLCGWCLRDGGHVPRMATCSGHYLGSGWPGFHHLHICSYLEGQFDLSPVPTNHMRVRSGGRLDLRLGRGATGCAEARPGILIHRLRGLCQMRVVVDCDEACFLT